MQSEPGVAAADHHHMLAGGEDRLVGPDRLAAERGDFAAAGNPSRNGRPPRSRPGTGRSRGFSAPPASTTASIVVDKRVGRRCRRRHATLQWKIDALGLHLLDAAVDQMLLHLEVGDAIAQQAAGLGVLFVDMHLVADARELLRAGKAGRAGADDRDVLAGLARSAARA